MVSSQRGEERRQRAAACGSGGRAATGSPTASRKAHLSASSRPMQHRHRRRVFRQAVRPSSRLAPWGPRGSSSAGCHMCRGCARVPLQSRSAPGKAHSSRDAFWAEVQGLPSCRNVLDHSAGVCRQACTAAHPKGNARQQGIRAGSSLPCSQGPMGAQYIPSPSLTLPRCCSTQQSAQSPANPSPSDRPLGLLA